MVTGAAGLIGSALVPRLAESWDVVGVVRRPVPMPPGVRMVVADLADPDVASQLPARADALVHLAQSEHFRNFPAHTADVLQVNVLAAVRLLDWARGAGVRSAVLASSGGVYGPGGDAFTEDNPVVARTGLGFYLGSKLCSEILAAPYAAFFPVQVLRYFFVFGPDQRADMLLPRLVASVREGRPVQLQGDVGLSINPTWHDDAAAATARALALTDSHVINVAGPEVASLRAIAEHAGALVGRAPIFERTGDVPPPPLVGDVRLMSRLLLPPVVGVRDGLARYVARRFPSPTS